MIILSVWNPKGGQGKSLIALNTAAAAVQLNLVPIVICQDPQGTSTLFHRGGNLPFEVISSVPDEPPEGVDLVIFDHAASDWEMPRCKTLVMPVKPERSQFATYVDAKRRAEEAGKRIITVVTDGNMQRKAERNTVLALRQRGAFEVRSSGAFGVAGEEYRTIFDSKLNGVYHINDRRKEFEALLAAILGNVNDEKSIPKVKANAAVKEVEHA